MYFFVLAGAIVGWWTLLLAAPAARPYFAIRDAPFVTVGSFAFGDLGIIAIGAALVGARDGRGWAFYAAWLVSGALLYATCFVLAAAVTGISSPLGACLMVPASVASLIASAILNGDAHADSLPPRSSA